MTLLAGGKTAPRPFCSRMRKAGTRPIEAGTAGHERGMSRARMTRHLVAIALFWPAGAMPLAAQSPIPGARDWLLVDRLPGNPGHACTARAEGPEADTMLLLNRRNVPILAAGRADWRDLGGPAEISLSIDGEAPRRLSAYMVANLVLTELADAALVERLRAARTLDWTLPFGRFRANVSGLGTALDRIGACVAARGASSDPAD